MSFLLTTYPEHTHQMATTVDANIDHVPGVSITTVLRFFFRLHLLHAIIRCLPPRTEGVKIKPQQLELIV